MKPMTREEALDILRIARDQAVCPGLGDSTPGGEAFVRWHDMDALFEHIKHHGFPPPGSRACKTISGMNRAAQSLGRRAKGVPKRFSKDEIARRTARILAAKKASLEKKKFNTERLKYEKQ